MSKLRIFIEGEELDSLESVTVPITKQFEELSDPTVICNDYSKTVTVPLSKRNNEIFGHCYNPDRLTAYSGDENTPLIGIYFDPYKKLDCRLQWGDAVFFTGYAKMLKVTNKGYEVTINGELGKIFQELQKITFDKSKYEDEEDIAKYWIDGSKYVQTTISKDLVYGCWLSAGHSQHELKEVGDSGYSVSQIIGFIPNNSYSDNFDHSTVELSDGTAKSIEDVLGEDFETTTGYSRESIIGDGLYPVQMNQWRSYEQIPFIYWDMFWQIFAKKGEELTGYKWQFADDWGEATNKNYSSLAVALSQRDFMNISATNKTDSEFSVTINAGNYTCSLEGSSIAITQTKGEEVDDYNIRFNVIPSFTVKLQGTSATTAVGFYWGQPTSTTFMYGGLIANFKYTDTNGTTTFLRVGFCQSTDSTTFEGNALYWLKHWYTCDYYVDVANSTTKTEKNIFDFTFGTTEALFGNVTTKGSGGAVSIDFEYVSYDQKTTYPSRYSAFYAYGDNKAITTYTMENTVLTISPTYYVTNFRSGDEFTLSDICNLDFSNILDYCKRFRLHISVDEEAKALMFSRSLFSNVEIVDMTDKVDSSTFDIEPVTFGYKYLEFGYADSESKLGERYADSIGYQYGAKKIDTGYNFSDETDSLFSKTPETILYSPTYLDYALLTASKPSVTYWCRVNRFLECRDSDGKIVDVAGALFYPKRTIIDQSVSARQKLTDDTTNMALLDKYYYNVGGTNSRTTNVWTTPEVVFDDPDIPNYKHTCLWAVPSVNYTSTNSYYKNAHGVYDNFWANYISERYNTQNKKVTTYVRLSPMDFINFKFSQLWQIGNQIYMVNKISDYDITSDGTTKVELITVQNINNYK